MELPTITEPDMPGAFKGDIWFGHSEKRNLGTHRWDGEKWIVLPSEIEVLLILLAKARAERDHWLQFVPSPDKVQFPFNPKQ